MKKILVFCTMLVFLITQIPLEASAVKALNVTVNGQVLNLSVPPLVEGKEVLLPAKELIEALGGTYFWVNSSKILAIKKDNIKIGLPLNTNTAILNGETVMLKSPPKLIKNRMYVPAKFICESLGASYVYDVPKNTVHIETALVLSIIKDESIGTRLNDTFSGAWWGENIAKIARTADTTFTSVLSSESGQRTAYLYEKKDNGAWVEGEAFAASRPVNILADSKGYIHVIGFEPLNPADENTGRIMYVTFDKPNTVKGTYQKTYLTQSNNKTEKPTLETYGTIFCGAAIGKDNTILVAYDNTIGAGLVGVNSIGVRIYNPLTKTWTYETVRDKMASRYCYPFAFVSDKYYHILAVEDMYDKDYALLTPPHNTYQFRYGAVKHFQRLRTGGPWEEATILDFNNKPNIGKQQIADASLRIMDFTVDSENVVHAILKYNGIYNGDTLVYSNQISAYDYSKAENQNNWKSTQINFDRSLNWAKIWERKDKKNFYLIADYNGLYLVPLGGGNTMNINSPSKDNKFKPSAPFVTSRRSGSPLSNTLHIVSYAQPEPTVARYMEVRLASE